MTTNRNAVQPAALAAAYGAGPATLSKIREFDTERKHGVGQFLRSHPDAARVMARMRSDSKGFFSIAARARLS